MLIGLVQSKLSFMALPQARGVIIKKIKKIITIIVISEP